MNNYAGQNYISQGVWKVKVGSGSYTAPSPDAVLNTGDWDCEILGGSHPFVFVFNLTDMISDINDDISVKLEGVQSLQDSMITTLNSYCVITWRDL